MGVCVDDHAILHLQDLCGRIPKAVLAFGRVVVTILLLLVFRPQGEKLATRWIYLRR
jgi:hypothetical protein